MGTLVELRPLIERSDPRFPDRPTRTPRTIAHIRRALQRYARDLALMEGQVAPGKGDLDDHLILEHFEVADDKAGMIRDRKLQIMTLEATIDALIDLAREDAQARRQRRCGRPELRPP